MNQEKPKRPAKAIAELLEGIHEYLKAYDEATGTVYVEPTLRQLYLKYAGGRPCS